MGDNGNELIPIVDENSNCIGSMRRSEAHSGSKILHPVVHLHIINSQKDIYLQKRPCWKDVQPGKWDTACGGHIGYGEDVHTALYREVKEELGITDYTPRFIKSYVFESEIEKELVNVFLTEYNGPITPSDELDCGRFWTIKEIIDMTGNNILTPNFEDEFKHILLPYVNDIR